MQTLLTPVNKLPSIQNSNIYLQDTFRDSLYSSPNITKSERP